MDDARSSASGPTRNLLFLTPEPPALTGGGTPMRAGVTLQALLEDFRVYTAILQARRDPDVERAADSLLRKCAGVAYHNSPNQEDRAATMPGYPRNTRIRNSSRDRIDDITALFPGVRFDALHVLKVYLAPFVGALLFDGGTVESRIDLDDYETVTRTRIADLCERNGEAGLAASYRQEAARYDELQRQYLPRARVVFVCSEMDRLRVMEDYGLKNVRVLPNAISGEPPVAREASPDDPFTFLFPATLNYLPNEDAAGYFVREVLPLVRRRVTRPIRVLIAGRRVSRTVKALRSEEVVVEGWTEDVASWYRRSDALVVPVRAGGGTRIKILEGFCQRRPVVSTAAAAEGLRVCDGVHLRIADDPSSFARWCSFIAENPLAQRGIVDTAYRWVRENHLFRNFLAAIREPDQDCGTGERRPVLEG